MATYRGKYNPYVGYKKDKRYKLKVWHHSECGYDKIAVERADKPDEGYQEYETIVVFLKNWDNIKILK